MTLERPFLSVSPCAPCTAGTEECYCDRPMRGDIMEPRLRDVAALLAYVSLGLIIRKLEQLDAKLQRLA